MGNVLCTLGEVALNTLGCVSEKTAMASNRTKPLQRSLSTHIGEDPIAMCLALADSRTLGAAACASHTWHRRASAEQAFRLGEIDAHLEEAAEESGVDGVRHLLTAGERARFGTLRDLADKVIMGGSWHPGRQITYPARNTAWGKPELPEMVRVVLAAQLEADWEAGAPLMLRMVTLMLLGFSKEDIRDAFATDLIVARRTTAKRLLTEILADPDAWFDLNIGHAPQFDQALASRLTPMTVDLVDTIRLVDSSHTARRWSHMAATLRDGLQGTPYEGGAYRVRVSLPSDYLLRLPKTLTLTNPNLNPIVVEPPVRLSAQAAAVRAHHSDLQPFRRCSRQHGGGRPHHAKVESKADGGGWPPTPPRRVARAPRAGGRGAGELRGGQGSENHRWGGGVRATSARAHASACRRASERG